MMLTATILYQESRRATRESAKGGNAWVQGGISSPSTSKADDSARGVPLQTPKRPPQRLPQMPAGRTSRHNLPSKRTLDASEDAEQRDPPQCTRSSLYELGNSSESQRQIMPGLHAPLAKPKNCQAMRSGVHKITEICCSG